MDVVWVKFLGKVLGYVVDVGIGGCIDWIVCIVYYVGN